MKICLISDTHFGCRKNSTFFIKQQKEFFDNRFFPYLIEHKIDTILHLGDFFHSREKINFDILRHSKECFIDPIIEGNFNLHMLVGNHDSYYKSNGDLTSTKLLFSDIDNIHIYDELEQLTFSDNNFLMVPWIFPQNQQDIIDKIKLSTVDVCCGHFEMIGVAFNATSVSRKGIDPDNFSHFPCVFSGHYHKPSKYYIGSPYQMTWNDYGDKKRIVIYDTDTRTYESVFLSEDVFTKIEYPLTSDIHLSFYKDKVVRVIVNDKDDIEHFNNFIDELESVDPYSIDIKEEHLYVDTIHNYENNEQDTISILLDSVDTIDDISAGDSLVIKDIISKLYNKVTK